MKLPEILKSKKAQAVIVGLVTVLCKDVLGLGAEEVKMIVALVGTYVLGQGLADNGKEAAKVDKAPAP